MSAPLRRAPALLVSALFVAAAVWPALREPPRDSFPLSNYPMFSTVRDKPWLDVIVGFDAEGEEHEIRPNLVANIEVMQAAQTIRRAVRARRAKLLCARVAERVAADGELGHIVRLEVQRRRFDPRTYFLDPEVDPDGATPLAVRRKARCRVPVAKDRS
ncbi:hypothetical protein ENSA5_66620 [Enhygromyxa salina]|uniref:Uncharacterized protein n=1 Tax=Enhygromyxa salina TaxID=215803 RepID=A0A2S9XBS0_9BACT|nr:hypothetical protein [Enhygromyxa salina]PRP90250.1 hypothetical protein ENSA5_66620 [Enhygromyxa salina]